MEEEKKQHFYEVNNDIGRAYQELRKHQGLSVEQAAEKTGLTVKRIQAIERGALVQHLSALCNQIEAMGGRLAIVPAESTTDPHCQFIEFE